LAGEERKQGRGCLFYGCLTVIILALIVVGVLGYGLWKAKEYAFQYTDTKPAEFPEANVSPEMLNQTLKKLDAFSTTMNGGKETATLTLTADEINVLINNHKDFEALKGKVYVAFKENTATGKVSIPLDRLLPSRLVKGRYLNGSATLDISARDGQLFIFLTSLEANGKQVPAVFMDKIREVNLAENQNQDPQEAQKLKRIKSLVIKDGTMIAEVQPGS